MCLFCGKCPKIVNSDGNAKDCIQVTSNMKFDFKDQSCPPDLDDFKMGLAVHVLKTAFWQNEPKLEVNMLKLPIIMAPGILAKQVNNDTKKESLLDKSIQHSAETYREFIKMIDNKEINVTKLGSLKLADLKEIGRSLKFQNVTDKSGQMLRQELQHLAKTFIAGQVCETAWRGDLMWHFTS